MTRCLAAVVHLRDPETRRVVTFAPGEVPPAWAAEQITNDAAWAAEDVVAEVVGVPAGDGGDVGEWTEPEVVPVAVVDKPAGNASKAEWAAYAVAHGMDPDEADALTRDDLRDRYED